MYHDEMMVDDILYYRTKPRGQWTQYTIQELSIMYRELRIKNDLQTPKRNALSDTLSVVEFIKKGKTIKALKRYRTNTGCSLREAKTACEEIRKRLAAIAALNE